MAVTARRSSEELAVAVGLAVPALLRAWVPLVTGLLPVRGRCMAAVMTAVPCAPCLDSRLVLASLREQGGRAWRSIRSHV